jgi:imidazolonepropionase-like amidohydrolase
MARTPVVSLLMVGRAGFALLPAVTATSAGAQAPPVLFEHVSVATMQAAEPLLDRNVLVRDGRIVAIGAAGRVPAPAGAVRVNGRGRTLLPGLAEMHAHVPPGNPPPEFTTRVLTLYLANGLTTVRGMLGDPKHLVLRDQLARGDVFGPRLVTSGPSLNGGSVPSVAAAQAMVQAQRTAGYDFMKIHPGITRTVFDSLAATADRVGIGFAGHVPVDVGLGRALSARFRSIDHVDGVVEALLPADKRGLAASSQFFGLNLIDDVDTTRVDSLVAAIKASGVWIVPTQTLFVNVVGEEPPESIAARPEMRYWPPEQVQQWVRQKGAFLASAPSSSVQRARYLALRDQIMRGLRDQQVAVLLGSDAPQIWNVPGFSAHRELQAMVDAGFTPYQALRAGTVSVARFLGDSAGGVVAVGAPADLLLVEGNPLADISATQRIAGVMRGGRWHDRADLDRRLATLRMP